MTYIYHTKTTDGTRVYIVPDHYNHSLEYIKETLEEAKSWGLTIPKDENIRFEVLKGDRHSRKLSIEFTSKTPLNEKVDGCHLCDLDLYPHMNASLVY